MLVQLNIMLLRRIKYRWKYALFFQLHNAINLYYSKLIFIQFIILKKKLVIDTIIIIRKVILLLNACYLNYLKLLTDLNRLFDICIYNNKYN